MSHALVRGDHRLTPSTEGAQKDHDFHTQTLGLSTVTRIVLCDGSIPICRLDDGSRRGDASTVVPDNPGPQSVVAVIKDRASKPGTSMPAGGTVHHRALKTGTDENQIAMKGFTDVLIGQSVVFPPCFEHHRAGVMPTLEEAAV